MASPDRYRPKPREAVLDDCWEQPPGAGTAQPGVQRRAPSLRPPANRHVAIHSAGTDSFDWARAAAGVAIQEWVLSLPGGTAPSHPRP